MFRRPSLALAVIKLAQFTLALSDVVQKVLRQLNGFSLGICLQNREAAHYFLRFRERAVRNGYLIVGSADPHTLRRGKASFG